MNRLALYSLIVAAMTVISFCVGVAPIPLTAPLCYPSALLLGLLALILGGRGLRQVRSSGERGRRLALVGIWTGGMTLLAVLCATSLTLLFVNYGAEALQAIWARWAP